MNIEKFLQHHGLTENPFEAEEARHDAVFHRLIDQAYTHPDFAKILGRIDQPSTAVVFGEKGVGKTAMRLMIARRLNQFNQQNPDRRMLLVCHEDLNPFLDRIIQARRGGATTAPTRGVIDAQLKKIRLADHQDAMLSLGVTKLVDALLETKSHVDQRNVPASVKDPKATVAGLPRRMRVDLAVLATLYDQPRTGGVHERWTKLKRMLNLGCVMPSAGIRWIAMLLTVAAIVFYGLVYFGGDTPPAWAGPTAIGTGAVALLTWICWIWKQWSNCSFAGRLRKEMPAVNRNPKELRRMLLSLPGGDLADQAWPLPGAEDSRYQLTDRFLELLEPMGYAGMLMLVDRVDEPNVISGKAERMRPVVWPLFDHKFLQQEQVGVKLLLPIELRHLLLQESSDFFQEARLDKQNLIERLAWSGATLYDLCNSRMRACLAEADKDKAITLTDLFEGVSREMLEDALDQMHQPRDAFKFLYQVIQEHCRTVSDDHQQFRVPKLTLDGVRRQQAQRVLDLARGISPA